MVQHEIKLIEKKNNSSKYLQIRLLEQEGNKMRS